MVVPAEYHAALLKDEDFYLLELSEDLEALGEPKQLARGGWGGGGPAWTRDGSQVIFSRDWPPRLWKVPVDGRAKPQLLESVGSIFAITPTLSSQGDDLVYAQATLIEDIWQVEIDSRGGSVSKPTRIAPSSYQEKDAQFSPDGQTIAFSSSRTADLEIWVCDSDGSNAIQLTSFGGSFSVWSSDGEQIAFKSVKDGQAEIYAIDANGGNLKRLTNSRSSKWPSSWSRDGKWVYFGSDLSGSWQLWKSSVDSGEAVQLTEKGMGWSALESLDGDFVYYGKKRGIWRLPANGGEESQIVESGFALRVVKEGIYFTRRPEGSMDIHFFRFEDGKTKLVLKIKREKESNKITDISPDGKRVLYHQIDQGRLDLMLVKNFR